MNPAEIPLWRWREGYDSNVRSLFARFLETEAPERFLGLFLWVFGSQNGAPCTLYLVYIHSPTPLSSSRIPHVMRQDVGCWCRLGGCPESRGVTGSQRTIVHLRFDHGGHCCILVDQRQLTLSSRSKVPRVYGIIPPLSRASLRVDGRCCFLLLP